MSQGTDSNDVFLTLFPTVWVWRNEKPRSPTWSSQCSDASTGKLDYDECYFQAGEVVCSLICTPASPVRWLFMGEVGRSIVPLPQSDARCRETSDYFVLRLNSGYSKPQQFKEGAPPFITLWTQRKRSRSSGDIIVFRKLTPFLLSFGDYSPERAPQWQ